MAKKLMLYLCSAQLVVDIHTSLTDFLRAGLTLPEIDSFVAKRLQQLKCKSAFLKYKIPGQPPFPSHSCLSVNDLCCSWHARDDACSPSTRRSHFH